MTVGGRTSTFDPDAVKQAVLDGKMAQEIADMLGMSVAMLPQHCSQLSLMRKRVLGIEPVTVELPADIAAKLKNAAEERRMKMERLRAAPRSGGDLATKRVNPERAARVWKMARAARCQPGRGSRRHRACAGTRARSGVASPVCW
jgi:hypothetical protein